MAQNSRASGFITLSHANGGNVQLHYKSIRPVLYSMCQVFDHGIDHNIIHYIYCLTILDTLKLGDSEVLGVLE